MIHMCADDALIGRYLRRFDAFRVRFRAQASSVFTTFRQRAYYAPPGLIVGVSNPRWTTLQRRVRRPYLSVNLHANIPFAVRTHIYLECNYTHGNILSYAV